MNHWDDIKYFLEVARSGNVTSAAKALGVNHSTVSRRIHALESRHGIRLFERLPNGYQLTTEAADIFDLALAIEARNFEFERKLLGQESRLSGKISLTMPNDLFINFMVNHLAKFSAQYPNIQLDLGLSKGLRNLTTREADIAIRMTDKPPEDLIGKKITNLEHAVYQSKSTILKSTTPIISWRTEQNTPLWAIEHFKSPKVVMQVDDLYSMYSAVKAGIGLARMPCFIHNFVNSKEVIQLSTPLTPSTWGVWVLSHVDLRKTTRINVLKNFLVAQLTEHIDSFKSINNQ